MSGSLSGGQGKAALGSEHLDEGVQRQRPWHFGTRIRELAKLEQE